MDSVLEKAGWGWGFIMNLVNLYQMVADTDTGCVFVGKIEVTVQPEMSWLVIPTFRSGIKYLTLVEKKLQTVLVLRRYCKY